MESLPQLAWVARIRPPVADLYLGTGVRRSDAGVFEGTWAGTGGDLGPLRSTTPFGSGVLVQGDSIYLVTPGHTVEGAYIHRPVAGGGGVVASNSLVGLLVATGLELDPRVAYPALFNESVHGVAHTAIPVRGGEIETCFRDNMRIDLDGTLSAAPKRPEEPFADFADYRGRLSAALATAIDNAPGYKPVVTISSGYDGAAMAVLLKELGGRCAVTISDGKPARGSDSLSDSGEPMARSLGLDVRAFDRLAYRHRSDLPEADFLATGFTGEEVVFSGMEDELRGAMLVTGFVGDGMWWRDRPPRPLNWRSDQSGSSFGEWRLRTGFVHVPLPVLGSHDYRVTQRISRSAEMWPWTIGVSYDKPIPRRILEEAGVPRGSFGDVKRAASGTIQSDGPQALAPATLESVRAFADAEGSEVTFTKRSFPLVGRVAIKATRKAHLESVAAAVERRKYALAVTEPVFGSLLLRWAVSVVRPRYQAIANL